MREYAGHQVTRGVASTYRYECIYIFSLYHFMGYLLHIYTRSPPPSPACMQAARLVAQLALRPGPAEQLLASETTENAEEVPGAWQRWLRRAADGSALDLRLANHATKALLHLRRTQVWMGEFSVRVGNGYSPVPRGEDSDLRLLANHATKALLHLRRTQVWGNSVSVGRGGGIHQCPGGRIWTCAWPITRRRRCCT